MENIMKSNSAERHELYMEAYRKVYMIGNKHDLRKNKLTFIEYEIVKDILKEFANTKDRPDVVCQQQSCYLKGVADWFERCGFKIIRPIGEEVNYRILL